MVSMKDVVVKKPTAEQVAEAKKWPIWEHAAATFEWFYTEREKCLILQGNVIVRSADGKESVSFGAGDWVEFPTDLECVWEIKEAVRKHYSFE
jgi:uncharacterized cupin superfamily protein